jgi:hypothetical protein
MHCGLKRAQHYLRRPPVYEREAAPSEARPSSAEVGELRRTRCVSRTGLVLCWRRVVFKRYIAWNLLSKLNRKNGHKILISLRTTRSS